MYLLSLQQRKVRAPPPFAASTGDFLFTLCIIIIFLLFFFLFFLGYNGTMAPIRRYLRITKYSVLEVRIYVHKPSDVAWLLSLRDDVLQRIIQEVRPQVLPKLREENENARKKSSGKKKRGIKDVVSREDFEVSIFLKDTSTRHSLLTKKKEFREKPRIQSTGNKLTEWLNNKENPIRIEEDEEVPRALREESEEEVVELKDVPEAVIAGKRKTVAAEDDEDEGLFVSSSDEEFFATQKAKQGTRPKRRKRNEKSEDPVQAVDEQDDKKKLMLDTSYDGFSIYGRILCLIVTRKGKREATSTANALVDGSQMMEQWIGTQAAHDVGMLDDDQG